MGANGLLTRVEDGHTYSGLTELRVMTCPVCGVIYAIPSALQASAVAKGEGKILWFCPNGHELGYHGKSKAEREADRLREHAQNIEYQRLAEHDLRVDTEKRLSAQKAATTRAKRRAAAALCPYCNRSFVQLRRHLETKHPDCSHEAAR